MNFKKAIRSYITGLFLIGIVFTAFAICGIIALVIPMIIGGEGFVPIWWIFICSIIIAILIYYDVK